MFMKLLDALSRRVSESPLRALAALILLAIALVWAVSFLDRDHTRPVSTMPATDVANGVHTQQNLSDEDVRRVLETSREFHRRFSKELRELDNGSTDSTVSSSSRPLEPLEGQNAEAEKTIREIEAERPGYFKREDRTLIRAMIINDAKKENDGP